MKTIGTDKHTSHQESGNTGEVYFPEDINYRKRDKED
jgi:hypothetical protein